MDDKIVYTCIFRYGEQEIGAYEENRFLVESCPYDVVEDKKRW